MKRWKILLEDFLENIYLYKTGLKCLLREEHVARIG